MRRRCSRTSTLRSAHQSALAQTSRVPEPEPRSPFCEMSWSARRPNFGRPQRWRERATWERPLSRPWAGVAYFDDGSCRSERRLSKRALHGRLSYGSVAGGACRPRPARLTALQVKDGDSLSAFALSLTSVRLNDRRRARSPSPLHPSSPQRLATLREEARADDAFPIKGDNSTARGYGLYELLNMEGRELLFSGRQLARGAPQRRVPEPSHGRVLIDGPEGMPEVVFRDLPAEDDAGDAREVVVQARP